jgi:hypothetical protein
MPQCPAFPLVGPAQQTKTLLKPASRLTASEWHIIPLPPSLRLEQTRQGRLRQQSKIRLNSPCGALERQHHLHLSENATAIAAFLRLQGGSSLLSIRRDDCVQDF